MRKIKIEKCCLRMKNAIENGKVFFSQIPHTSLSLHINKDQNLTAPIKYCQWCGRKIRYSESTEDILEFFKK